MDYTRAEHLQFEDDEYYYYVKAIPKVSVAVREKTVKKINVRQEVEAAKTEKTSNNAAKQELKKNNQQEESEIQKIIEKELKH